MKIDRFSSASAWAAAVLRVGLFLFVFLVFLAAAGRPVAGQTFIYRVGPRTPAPEAPSKRLAKELARQVEEVRLRFAENRRALRTVPGQGGVPGYRPDEVSNLIVRTGEDLEQAIAQVGEPGLLGLSAWSAEKIQRIQQELAAVATVASSVPITPRAVAVVASLEWPPLPRLASAGAAQRQPTVSAEKADGLLDQVGAVVERIFALASQEDLEVKLWIGSTPAERVKFSFWPQGRVKGAPAARMIIRTNGKNNHVLRGLYEYDAALTDGAVTERIKYPIPAGAPAATASERLDLVSNSGFFCCRFDEHYCHHVEDQDECRP